MDSLFPTEAFSFVFFFCFETNEKEIHCILEPTVYHPLRNLLMHHKDAFLLHKVTN
jgi:hypothetical protein